MNRAGHRAPALASCAERSTPISSTLRAGQGCPLMLATALVPLIGYDKASQIAHHALEKDLTLKAGRSNSDSLAKPNSTASLIHEK
jgi:fumarate hydratase class II